MGDHADPVYPTTATGTGDRAGNGVGGLLDVAHEATPELQSHPDHANIAPREGELAPGMIGTIRPMTTLVDMVRRYLKAPWIDPGA